MSKERELLRRVWASERWDMPEDLQVDIKELIDQPEQEIACWGSFDLGGKCVGTHETRRLAAQIQGGNEVYPLYTAPPKQEPLSSKVVYIVQETSSDDVEFVFNTRKEAVEYVKQFDGVGSGYSFRIMEGIVWRRE